MTRRNGMPADSLELLLDTICNTFGGIIFIALLVVVLLMISGEQQAVQQSPEETAQAAAEVNELENLERLKARLESNLERQMKIVSTLTREDLPQTLAIYQGEVTRHTELESEIPQLQNQIRQNREEERELAKSMQELQLELTSIESQAAGLKESLEVHKASRKRTLRMPVVKPPGIKDEVLLVVQFNRLYLWHRYSRYGTREGLNTSDFLILSETADGVVTSPNPTAGIPLDDTSVTRQRIAQLLRPFDAKDHYLAVVVRPDSYGAFQYLRDAAVESGFEYELVPATSSSRFRDRGGSGARTQ